MADLKNPRLIIAKGFLFLLTGLLAGGVLLLLFPHWQVALLSAVMIWSFCRFYYFAFYVLEHYVEGDYRFAGLGSFVRYFLRQRSR